MGSFLLILNMRECLAVPWLTLPRGPTPPWQVSRASREPRAGGLASTGHCLPPASSSVSRMTPGTANLLSPLHPALERLHINEEGVW